MIKNWELDTVYSNQSFFEDVAQIRRQLSRSASLKEDFLNIQEAGKILKELESYASCLIAQNSADQQAHICSGEVLALSGEFESSLYCLGVRLAKLEEKEFELLLEKLEEIRYFLCELREITSKKSAEEEEAVINALSTEGYHGLWSLYQIYTGKIKIGKEGLSIGQAQNLLSSSDRQDRLEAFKEWNSSLKPHTDFLGQLLNQLGGFRLKVYKIRGWEDILEEPLYYNRMTRATHDAMWQAVEEAKDHLIRYMKHKAHLLGVDKLAWVDCEAPLGKVDPVSYEKGCEIILEQFEKFHPKMAAFSRKALTSRWIESEDRPGKGAGGFCSSLPKSGQSRIFMTYSGTAANVATLAHELGHAYHNECVQHLPYFNQEAPLNLAETASTLAEMIVIDQSITAAPTPYIKQILLDDKLQRAVAFFMNIRSRLLFEMRFYEERSKGFVAPTRLSELMLEAQKEAYADALSSWDPMLWAWKLHFYATDVPFYNFPYTFGYLLSNGIYERARGGNYGEKLDAFLRDTAQMNVEDLGKKHLDVDLSKPDFWRSALQFLKRDVDAFIQKSS